MERISGVAKSAFLEIGDVGPEQFGKTVKMRGIVHNVRGMSGFTFVILRKRDGIVQLVQEEGMEPSLKNGDSIAVEGVVNEEKRAPGGFELRLTKIEVLSRPAAAMPIDIAKYKLNTSLDALLELRPVTLRNLQQRAIFKIQEGIARGFREYLTSQNFTEIHTPKIVSAGAEGGANIFKLLEYFHKS